MYELTILQLSYSGFLSLDIFQTSLLQRFLTCFYSTYVFYSAFKKLPN
jgi:hypothetical protein